VIRVANRESLHFALDAFHLSCIVGVWIEVADDIYQSHRYPFNLMQHVE